MKGNNGKANGKANGKGKSPYRKHAKREYLYSPAYQTWAEQFRPCKASQVQRGKQ